MKAAIHPEYKSVKVLCACGATWTTRSTKGPELRLEICSLLDAFAGDGVLWHALRTRQAGHWRFISFHVLVPGDWTVQQGHDLLERIEEQVRARVPFSTVFTHIEPIEDPASFQDQRLERPGGEDLRPHVPGRH